MIPNVHTKDWTDVDLRELSAIGQSHGGDGFDLLRVINSESACRADALNDNPKDREPDKRWNAAGLNQCMPAILQGLGFGTSLGPRARAEAFCRLSVTEQLPFVRRYFAPHAGKLVNVTAWYLANFLPAFLPHAVEPEFVLGASKAAGFGGAVFAANASFDRDGDRKIQVRELGEAVIANFRGVRAGELARRYGEVTGHVVVLPATGPARPDMRTWLGAQTALAALGYYHGPIDGIWGPRSRIAVGSFQADQGLQVDEMYGPITRAALQIAFGRRPPEAA